MNFIEFNSSYSKFMLRSLLKMEETKFKTWLRAIEPDLIKAVPGYSKFCKILSPRAFKFLMEEYGFDDPEEINNMIQNYQKNLGKDRNKTP